MCVLNVRMVMAGWWCLKLIYRIALASVFFLFFFFCFVLFGSSTGCIAKPIGIAFQCQHHPNRPLLVVEHEAKTQQSFFFPCIYFFGGNRKGRHFYRTNFLENYFCAPCRLKRLFLKRNRNSIHFPSW